MSTTDVLKVSGDYKIIAKNGNITLDLNNGNQLGTVIIDGNLNVIGDSTAIQTIDTVIEDNILVLNSGELNNYITKGTSGILIARGNNDDLQYGASLLYNDNLTWNDSLDSYGGLFVLSAGQNGIRKLSALQLKGLRTDGNSLNVFGTENPFAVINVKGTVDYENQVIDDDDIPNKKYVDDRSLATVQNARQIKVGDAIMRGFAPTESPSSDFYALDHKIEAYLDTVPTVVFKLEGVTAQVQGVLISNNSISVTTSTNDLILDPPVDKSVKIDGSVQFLNVNAPSVLPSYTGFYSTSTIGGGGTGLYFVNTSTTDELTSRRRTILYSIIF